MAKKNVVLDELTDEEKEVIASAEPKTYPICTICAKFQGVTQSDLIAHLKEAHGIVKNKLPVDFKDAQKTIDLKTIELENKEKELTTWEEDLTKREADFAKTVEEFKAGK